MKLTFSFLVLLCGTAAADSVTLQPVPTSDPLPLVSAWSACSVNKQRVQTTKMVVEGHTIDLLRQCDSKDPQVEIAFEAKDASWHLYASGSAFGAQSTVIGKLKDGRHALIHRLDIDQTTHVDVCAYDKKTGVPACGFVEVECPETGCQAPTMTKGALWVHAKGGRKKFNIQ